MTTKSLQRTLPSAVVTFFVIRNYYVRFENIENSVIFVGKTEHYKAMCKIDMTFEVPDTQHLNIEALKKQMHSYLEYILSIPSIEQADIAQELRGVAKSEQLTSDWRSWEIEPELMEMVSGTRKAKFADSDVYYKEAITQAMEERYESLS